MKRDHATHSLTHHHPLDHRSVSAAWNAVFIEGEPLWCGVMDE